MKNTKNLDFAITAICELALSEKNRDKIPQFLKNERITLSEVKNRLNSEEYQREMSHKKGLIFPALGEKESQNVIENQRAIINSLS